MAAQEKNKSGGAAKRLQKSYFDVLGLCCTSEVPLVENILKSLEGVKEYSVIVTTKTVMVVHDNLLTSQLQIVKALNQAGLEANIRVYGVTNYKNKWPSPYAVASGVALSISLLKYVYPPLQWFALGAVAIGILPVVLKGFASIKNFRLDSNILVVIAVIGTIAMRDYTEAGAIVFLFTIAEWLESRASYKANAVMSSLMSLTPQKAVIAETGEEVDTDEVKLNTVLAVKAGEVIPIDGVVVDGNCEVDEKTLTGESFPVSKQKDSIVWAGTVNLNGYVSVKTTALAEDCVVAKMAKLVEDAQNCKSRTQRFIDRCAQYYTPAIIIISAGLAVVPLVLRVHNRNHWFHLALVVLVSACPCALLLSTPVATFCALTKAATAGLLFKGGNYLETLAKIRVMAFDKTGTITKGEFVVTDFKSLYGDVSLETLLYWVSSIESKSGHPMAAALVNYGRSCSVEPKPEDVEEFQNFPGEGVHGKIDGKDIYIGNRKMAVRSGYGSVPTEGGYAMSGRTIGYIYCGGNLAGIFSLIDSCRTGVLEAIEDLKSMSIKTAMLTGDSQAAAFHTQEQLGHSFEVVHAELLPEDKAKIIKRFMDDEGPTAMVGDGLNDAPALATADIGISMGISGSALATETGHVILMSNDIRKVPKAIQLAKKAHRKVIENVILSIATKAAIIALAFAGHPLVWAAVLADTGTCLVVIMNSMLLLRRTHRRAGKCCRSSSDKLSDKNSSHEKKHCCSGTARKVCGEAKSCASDCNSCSEHSNSKSSCKGSSAQNHDRCTGARGAREVKHHNHDHGCCNTEEVKSHDRHGCSSLCGKKELEKSAEKCTHVEDSLHEKKHSRRHHHHHNHQDHCHHHDHQEHHQHNHHPHGETVIHHGIPESSNHSLDLENNGRSKIHKASCQSSHCCRNSAKSHCSSVSHKDVVQSNSNCEHQNLELNNISKNCCKASSEVDRCETKAAHACKSLERRENGGCCKSYMKECCSKYGQFGNGLGAGISEIVTE
ncbi:hypothetical protein K2173_016020 [Erythroxylum novogranatense]|uniref:HMA domain-containing protein n=1 Tax=Erythroxylum novogranatense TaxID=1862640 RepID=A0AAV8SFP0_9ROSI|nr:hypothetical protein K2173_016020 [Erythroxylum novogranatense]